MKLLVIPTEKLFASTRNLFVVPRKIDSSVAKSFFRMTGSVLLFPEK
jgi:hypothetical protein